MRVLICDDHPVYRDGLRVLLGELEVEVVGEASSGEESVSLALDLRPDVVIMDLHMPGVGGVEATRRIVAAAPEVRVLALTMIDEQATLLAALRAGAGGYLLKGAGHVEIRLALQSVASGNLMVSAPVAERLRAGLQPAGAHHLFPQLSARELEVLEMLSRGRTNEHIAEVLVLSVKTVRNLVSSILGKLGAGTRAEAVAMARDAGLGSVGSSPR